MRQYIYTLPLVVFLFLCTACTQADIVLPDGSGGNDDTDKGVSLSLKNLGLSVEVESRSIVTGGPQSDAPNPNPLTRVGLYVTKKSTGGSVSAYNGKNAKQLFLWDAGGWKLAEGEEALCLHSEKGTVYAWSPAEKSIVLMGSPKEPVISGIRVLDKQKFAFTDGGAAIDPLADVQWETDQEDYLYCTVADQVDRWNPEVSLTMYHALAKVSFRVWEADGGVTFSDSRVKQVVLKSSGGFKRSTSARLNLATGGLGGTMTAVDQLSFAAGGNMRAVGTGVVDGYRVAVQAFGMVIPVTGASVRLELTLDDGRVFTMLPSGDGVSVFTVDWSKGNNYIYDIKLSPQGLLIARVEVAGWNDGGTTEVPVE